jgi:hypothetical protein
MGPVFTLNYDHVIKTVYDNTRSPFRYFAFGGQIKDLPDLLWLKKPVLVKLHGDADNDETRILTEAEYRRHFHERSLSKVSYELPIPQGLRWLFRREVVLFLGCSLTCDRYTTVLRDAMRDHTSFSPHFAILPEFADHSHDGSDFKLRLEFLRERRVQPIWYPSGEHTAVEIILSDLLAGEPASQPDVTKNEPRPVAGESFDVVKYVQDHRILPGTPFAGLVPNDLRLPPPKGVQRRAFSLQFLENALLLDLIPPGITGDGGDNRLGNPTTIPLSGIPWTCRYRPLPNFPLPFFKVTLTTQEPITLKLDAYFQNSQSLPTASLKIVFSSPEGRLVA